MAALFGSGSIKRLIIDGLTWLLPFRLLKNGLPENFIIYGHVVSDHEHPVSNRYRYPSLTEFHRFVMAMRKMGYVFVTLPDFLKEDNRRKILVTFDDGFRVIYEDLHPYMKKEDIPYVIFVLTDPLEDRDFVMKIILPDTMRGKDRLFLSAEEIVALKQDGVHIGFHTRSHYKITNADSVANGPVINQVTIPQKYDHLFSRPLAFAYPFMAPDHFEILNDFMTQQFQFEVFMDTKGFRSPTGNHFFRVSIDAERSLRRSLTIKFIVKRQLLYYVLSKFK